MENQEIIINLWYVCDDDEIVYSLRGRCYLGGGTDQEKLDFLRRSAEIDYQIAQVFPVPARLHTRLNTENGVQTYPVTSMNVLETMGGPEVLFEEVYIALEKQLPANTPLSIGRDPLVCITPLLGSEDGTLEPFILGIRPTRRHNAALSGTSDCPND